MYAVGAVSVGGNRRVVDRQAAGREAVGAVIAEVDYGLAADVKVGTVGAVAAAVDDVNIRADDIDGQRSGEA